MFDRSPRAPLQEVGSSMNDEFGALRVRRRVARAARRSPLPASSIELEPPPRRGLGGAVGLTGAPARRGLGERCDK